MGEEHVEDRPLPMARGAAFSVRLLRLIHALLGARQGGRSTKYKSPVGDVDLIRLGQ